MLARISGMRDGVEWPNLGDTINVPAAEAVDLVGSGLVEIVGMPAKTERAIVEPVAETAQIKRGPGRPRKGA
jgi:hypothetical protein